MPTDNQRAAGGDSPAPPITVEDAVAFLADIDMYDEWPREVMVDQEKDAKIRAIAALLTDLQGKVERYEEKLREIDAWERASMYERCPDCDFYGQCSRAVGCLVIEKRGGSPVQQLARRALGEG